MISNNDISNIESQTGSSVIGVMEVQAPVYVINLQYLSKDKDPFYPVDRVIVQILDKNPLANWAYIAWLLGFEKEIVDSRLRYYLIPEGFLQYFSNGMLKVTESGQKKYMNEKGDRPDVEITGSIMVDGTTLELLPKNFYDGNYPLRYFKSGKTTIPHKPLLGLDDYSLLRAVKNIETRIANTHFSYGLEENPRNLQAIGIDDRYIDLDAIIMADSAGNINKRLYFRGEFYDFPSMKDITSKLYFFVDGEGNFCQNHGVTSLDNADKLILAVSPDVIDEIIIKRYKIKDRIAFSLCERIRKDAQYPMVIHVSKDLLKCAGDRRLLLADARKGGLDLFANGGGSMKVKVESDNFVSSLIKLDYILSEWKDNHDSMSIDVINKNANIASKDWRSNLCLIGRYEDLEEIDRKMYFRF